MRKEPDQPHKKALKLPIMPIRVSVFGCLSRGPCAGNGVGNALPEAQMQSLLGNAPILLRPEIDDAHGASI